MPCSVPEQSNYFEEPSDGLSDCRTSLIFFMPCSVPERSNYFKEMSDGLEVAGGQT